MGTLGRASRPHHSLPLGPGQLSCSPRVRNRNRAGLAARGSPPQESGLESCGTVGRQWQASYQGSGTSAAMMGKPSRRGLRASRATLERVTGG